MSYNISSCTYLSGELNIKRIDALKLYQKYRKDLPEDSFLEDLELEGSLDETLEIGTPCFCGEHSGFMYDAFLEILKKTFGNADLLLVWEDGDGDRLTGLRVQDGVVEEKKVHVLLG